MCHWAIALFSFAILFVTSAVGSLAESEEKLCWLDTNSLPKKLLTQILKLLVLYFTTVEIPEKYFNLGSTTFREAEADFNHIFGRFFLNLSFWGRDLFILFT